MSKNISDESQHLENGFPDARILECERLLYIIIGKQHSIVTQFIRICLVFFALPIVLILISWKEGNLVLPGPAIGLLEDWNILAMFGVFPAAVLLLIFAVRKFNRFVKHLVDLAIEDGTKNKLEIVAEIESMYSDITVGRGRWQLLRLIGIAIGILFVIFNAINRYFRFSVLYAPGFWTSSEYPLSFWVTNLYTMLVWGYIGPIVGYKLISLLTLIARIVRAIGSKFKFNIKVLSADRSGGLKELGSLALALSYVVLPFQLNCLAYFFWIPKVNVPFIFGVFTVLAFTIILFLVPVGLAHSAMIRLRDAVLEKVSDAYNLRLQEILNNSLEVARYEQTLTEMKGLDEIFNALLRIRVWPVDLSVIGRFSAIIIIPLLIAFLEQLFHLK